MTQPEHNNPADDDLGDRFAQLNDSSELPIDAVPPREQQGPKKIVSQSGGVAKWVARPSRFAPTASADTAEASASVPSPVDAQTEPTPIDASDKPETAKKSLVTMLGMLPLALILGAVLVLLLIPSLLAASTPKPTAAPLPTSALTAAPAVVLLQPTQLTMTPTKTPIEAMYIAAVAAFQAQNWQQAAEQFQQVYNANPQYLDVQDRLSAAFVHWGETLLVEGDTAKALVQLRNASALKPSDEASNLLAKLDPYETARIAIAGQDWATALDQLLKLRQIDPDFLNNADMLYATYMGRSKKLQSEGHTDAAMQDCRSASDLKPADAAAQDCITALATPIPPTPVPPVAFSTRIFDTPTDAAAQCGAAFDSRVWGVVRNKEGKGISGARVQVQSADRKNTFRKTTNSQGGFEIAGLGCTTWRVSLTYVPIEGSQLLVDSATVGLNGGRYSGAGVEFRQK